MAQVMENRFIDPAVLAGIKNLQLLAKTVVEGFISGLHQSPYHGFSLEFMEYREYTPGDDIRGIDWKVYARSDRFYVKKFQGETNTRIHILLDSSKSMAFSSHKLTKLEYASYLAASLAHFAVKQKDAAGLMVFDSEIRSYLPPRSRSGQFLQVLKRLEHLEPGGQTDISASLDSMSGLIKKRGLVVLISDFYQEVEEVTKALRFFHHRGNDLILFHLLDPVELELPLDKTMTLEDMETEERVPYDPETSREVYLRRLQDHIKELRRECSAHAIDYELINTEEPLDRALHRYLSVRSRNL
ncbi:MAG TPA: DUF58 domain-containing protein [Acidobacteriota bacterium]|nr:DUF58 domain-containing protein [Acidobacteriota bacterium]